MYLITFTNGEIKKMFIPNCYCFCINAELLIKGHIDNTSAELLTRYMGFVSANSL